MATSTIVESNDQLKTDTQDVAVDTQKVTDSKTEIQWFTTVSVGIVMVSAFVLLIAVYMYFFPSMNASSGTALDGPGWWDRLTSWIRMPAATTAPIAVPPYPPRAPPLSAAPVPPAFPAAAEPMYPPPAVSSTIPPVNPAVGAAAAGSDGLLLGQGPSSYMPPTSNPPPATLPAANPLSTSLGNPPTVSFAPNPNPAITQM
jgi:hypothetical protein